MVKPFAEHSIKVAGALAKGARRPQTLPTQVREMASGVVTGALYPWGFLDAGPGGRVRTGAPATEASYTPVLLVHGEDDPVVPFESFRRARAALTAAGVPVEAVTRPGLGHGIDEAGLEAAQAMLARCLGAVAGPV